MPKCVVITGASSGIGRALAIRYAGEGVTLGLIGRERDVRVREAFEDVAFAPHARGELGVLTRQVGFVERANQIDGEPRDARRPDAVRRIRSARVRPPWPGTW